MVIQLKMLPYKVFSLAVLVVVVSSQGLGRPGVQGGLRGAGMSGGLAGASVFGGIGGAGMQGGLGGAGMSAGLGGAGMPGGMGGAGMYGGMGEPGMFGGMGMMGNPLMNGDMMDTLSDMYGSRMAMQGFGFGSGLGNFPNPRPQFPMGQFLPQTGAWGGKGGPGRPPTQTFTGIGAIVKTISGIQGGGPPGKLLTGQATNDVAYFPRKNY